MSVIHNGYDLVSGDIKRISKKYKNITKDLDIAFEKFNEKYLLYKNTSDDEVYFDEHGIRGFEMKVAVASHGLSRQKGCRLWYLLVPYEKDIIFLPGILFDCREEKKYPKRNCLKILKERLEIFDNG